MSRVQPRALTDEELLQHIYMMNYDVPAVFVQELYERFAAMLDKLDERGLRIID